MIIEKTLNRFMLFLGAFLIIVVNNSLWYYDQNYSTIIKNGLTLCGIFMIILSFNEIVNKFSRVITFLSFYLFYVFAGSLFQQYVFKAFIRNFGFNFLMIFAIAFYYMIKEEDILDKIADIIFYYSIFSILTYLIFTIFQLVQPTEIIIPFMNNIPYSSYYDIYFHSNVVMINGAKFYRNGGIFVEPGTFSVYLTYALFMFLFFKNKLEKKKIVVLLLSIFLTLSTTGIMLSIIAISGKLVLTKSTSHRVNVLKRILIPVVAILSFIVISSLIIDKITTYGSVSYSVRMDDFNIALNLFKEKPLFGWGYNNYEPVVAMQNSVFRSGDVGGASNGIMNILYQGGIFLCIYYIVPLILLFKYLYKVKNNKLGTAMLFVYIIIQLTSYPFQDSGFMHIFLACGYASAVVKPNPILQKEK
jgi:hypothetical protein